MSKSKKGSVAPRGKLPTRTIRARAEALLLRPIGYDTVVEKILDAFPDASTSTKTVAWYASRMKARGVKLPERPRAQAA